MFQGTTPIHRFKLPFDSGRVAVARVIYQQCGRNVLIKTTEEFERDGRWIFVKLSQEETFLFGPDYVTFQLRVKDINGTPLLTKPRTISVIECLEKEVI